MDKPKAVTAAAHKLARMIYTMLTKGEEYTDQGQHQSTELSPSLSFGTTTANGIMDLAR